MIFSSEQSGGKTHKKESQFLVLVRRFLENKGAVVALSVFIMLMILCLTAPWITPYGFAQMNVREIMQTASMKHPLGTDDIGRDILARILYGGQYSISVGIIVAAMNAVVGVVFGAICGYFGGKIDTLFMRFLDIFHSIPAILLTIAFAAALGAGYWNTIAAISLSHVSSYVRIVRGSVMKVRTEEYIEAAEAIGCSAWRKILHYVVPNAWAPIIVHATMGVASTINNLATLSYIGLGVQPPAPEWGAMLSAGKDYIRIFPHMITVPGVFIAITVLCLNIAGDGLRDALDPKLKN
jgi:peptide/nickel transport system permease protein